MVWLQYKCWFWKPIQGKCSCSISFRGQANTKALTRIWPAYGSYLLQEQLGEIGVAVLDIIFMTVGHRALKAARDARTTCCCVYTPADIEHAMARYGFQEAEVVAVEILICTILGY